MVSCGRLNRSHSPQGSITTAHIAVFCAVVPQGHYSTVPIERVQDYYTLGIQSPSQNGTVIDPKYCSEEVLSDWMLRERQINQNYHGIWSSQFHLPYSMYSMWSDCGTITAVSAPSLTLSRIDKALKCKRPSPQALQPRLPRCPALVDWYEWHFHW